MRYEALFDRKCPIYVTAEQLAWIDDQRFSRRMESRSEVLRELIDTARNATSHSVQAERASGPAPEIRPYSPDAYPGMGMAPLLVPYLRTAGLTFYTADELAVACKLDPLTIEPNRKAAIALVMRACGFHPTRDLAPGGHRVEGWKI